MRKAAENSPSGSSKDFKMIPTDISGTQKEIFRSELRRVRVVQWRALGAKLQDVRAHEMLKRYSHLIPVCTKCNICLLWPHGRHRLLAVHI
jgi:hypothetical protein